jgi:hypothetical protein
LHAVDLADACPCTLQGQFPLVVIFLIAANFLYVRTAYSSEWYIRRDYIRLLKQQNEERRTTQFLEGMLPEVRRNEF